MSTVATERVLVIPTSLFRALGYFQGLTQEMLPQWEELLSGPHASYQPRSEMESDPDYKQIIPYVVFRHVGRDGAISLFKYRRGSGQGETRLHRKMSIGVGGHISRDDHREDGGQTYAEGLRRELDEEVTIATPYSSRLIGMINDDETDVGRVHLGVVHVYDVREPLVYPREDEMHDAGFARLEEIWRQADQLESWSHICLAALFPLP